MIEKHGLEAFISDIDKIISGESIIPSACKQGEEEYKELLGLAEILSKADYTNQNTMEKIWANICRKDELPDDELDMVAGGVNPNAMLDGKDKKNNL